MTVRPARENHQPLSGLWRFEQGQGRLQSFGDDVLIRRCPRVKWIEFSEATGENRPHVVTVRPARENHISALWRFTAGCAGYEGPELPPELAKALQQTRPQADRGYYDLKT